MKREIISLALNNLNDRHISDTVTFSPGAIQNTPERIVPMKKKRIISIALAAALILALGISAYAVFGYRFIVSHDMPEAGEYTSLSELRRIEKTVGYRVTAPESFSDGYTFSSLKIRGEAVLGESGEIEREYYGVHMEYVKPDSPDRYLDLNPILGETQSEPTELRTIDGVQVRLNLDHFKIVPDDYQETEEDLARKAEGHYYITFGSDNVKECNIGSAGFVLDGVEYMLSDMAATEGTVDELTQMAAELIATAKK